MNIGLVFTLCPDADAVGPLCLPEYGIEFRECAFCRIGAVDGCASALLECQVLIDEFLEVRAVPLIDIEPHISALEIRLRSFDTVVFVSLRALIRLDGDVVSAGIALGIEVVDEIASVKTGANDRPVTPVVIKSITISGPELPEPDKLPGK